MNGFSSILSKYDLDSERKLMRFPHQFDLDFVNVYRVKEFTFRPIVDSNQNHVSVWNCDGEILREAAINVK